jgi:YD repeat-containing protein
MWRRWRDSPAHDVAVAVLLTGATLAGAYGEAHPNQPADKGVSGHPIPYTPAAAYLLVVVAGLVLAGRRYYPVAVLIVSAAAVAIYSLLGYVNGAALLLPAFALYAVAAAGSVRRAVGAAAATLVLLLVSTAVSNPFGTFGGGFITMPGLLAVALFAGLAASSRRAYIASIQARSEDDARRRVDEERLRIARELHDVVAHTMATINVQAGVAAHVLADRPDAAAQALNSIKAASKDGLRELRAILNVLRQADDADLTQPAPGLAQLDALIAGTAQAGLATSLRVTGAARPLPAAADLAAYRIVQESLTNAIRHAGPATATVSLSYDDAGLRIEVADTGRGSGASHAGGSEGSGHGLIGMRERAASVGGVVQAGPAAECGYRVTARLPLDAPPPAGAEAGADVPRAGGSDPPEAGGAAVPGRGPAATSAAAPVEEGTRT